MPQFFGAGGGRSREHVGGCLIEFLTPSTDVSMSSKGLK